MDEDGDTIDFLLAAKRDQKAAMRFLKKAVRQHGVPQKINADKSGANAAGLKAFNDEHSTDIELRQVKGKSTVRYRYGLGKSVLTKDESVDGVKTLTRFVGEEFEIVEADGRTKQRTYVGDFLVIETEGSGYRENYLYKDYLGSTLVAADRNAAIVERMDYDPFGQRRNVENLDWLAAGAFQPKTTSRGFTGHDQIESMNLVHMKGRVYDPTIALFLTPDTYIQDPSMVQSLNRYSYVVNNPLRYNDPTGHFFTDHFFREVGRGIKSAGKALSNPGLYLEQTWNKFGRGVSDPRYLRLDGGDIGPHWDHTRKGEGKSGGRRIYPDGTVKPK